MKAASKLIALTSLGLATLLGGGCDIEWNQSAFSMDGKKQAEREILPPSADTGRDSFYANPFGSTCDK